MEFFSFQEVLSCNYFFQSERVSRKLKAIGLFFSENVHVRT